jgi:hypothetical protein
MTEKYKRPTMEELTASLEKEKAESKATICELMDYNDMLDDDGYPTDAALNIVEMWHWSDAKGWFKFIHSLWYLKSFGWDEMESIDELTNDRAWCYYISTAGWSGNEAIIRAMQKNEMMWHLQWVQSRRGGHYIFELKEFGDE